MKKLTTKISRSIKSLAIFMGIAVSMMGSVKAQAPYCSPSHSAGGCPSWSMYIGQIRVQQGAITMFDKANDACNQTAVPNYTFMGTKSIFALAGGGDYTMSFSTGPSYAVHIGVWIDLNGDYDFLDAGEWVSQGWTDIQPGGSLQPRNFKLSCNNIKTGQTRMRVRTDYTGSTPFSQASACNTVNYGETEDYTIDVSTATSVSADFIVPPLVWVNLAPNLINKNAKGYISHKWDVDNNPNTGGIPGGFEYQSIDLNSHVFTSAGNNYVKLKSTNCLGSDSTVKLVKVTAPTQAPVANFVASKTVLNQYDNSQLFDLSTNGAYQWSWLLYDSVTLGGPYVMDNSFKDPASTNQRPIFTFNNPGKYTVCLVSTNDVNPSAKFCKKDYITVNPPSEFRIGNGASSTLSSSGTIYDHAGPTAPYANNRSKFIDRLLIQPCGATSIKLNMTQLRFTDASDILKVYDGGDETGTLLGTYNSTKNGQRPSVTAVSGAMYITFESNSSGVDSGFIGNYTSVLGPQIPPAAHWVTACDTIFNGAPVDFKNTTTNKLGLMDYMWIVYDDQGLTPTFVEHLNNYTFYTDGKYRVTLVAQGCAGMDSFAQDVNVITPTSKVDLDFTADKLRPNIGDDVNVSAVSCKANKFRWSFFPTTVIGVPTNDDTKAFTAKFTAGGAYTVTLRSWNDRDSAATVRTMVKDKYIIVLDYCNPLVDIKSSDIGINEVEVKYNGTSLMENITTSGVDGYSNYTTTNIANLTFGAKYDLEVARNTNTDPANYKVWIDYNIDGDFTDAGELILNSGSSMNKSHTVSFTVPALNKSFEGVTRMRVAAAYDNYSNTPCGLNQVGEFEDYGIVLKNDGKAPIITLIGPDTVRIEKGTAYNETAYTTYTGFDATEGDLTPIVKTATDFDANAPGIYTYTFDLQDASGNNAVQRKRVIIVVLDKTKPVLTLTGANPMTVNVEDGVTVPRGYSEPGATAIDNVDGDLTTSITMTGGVNDKVIGTYNITYTACDVQNNCSSITRVVNVVDVVKPVIITPGTLNLQINQVWVDQTYAKDNYAGIIPMTVTPGFNGPVNTNIRATYPITYDAKDQSNNAAVTVVRNYRVDDFIAPEIDLNTSDTVVIEVHSIYNSKAVTVTDNYYSPSQVSLVSSGSVNVNILGLYVETFTAADASGNITVAKRYVRVVDTRVPEIWGADLNPCVGQEMNPMEGINVLDNYYAPATLLPMIKIIFQNVNSQQAGSYNIIYRVTDPSNNVSASFTRRILYSYAPNCAGTGINAPELDKKVSVFPNPTSGSLKVSYDITYAKEIGIKVTDAVGRQVLDLGTVSNTFGNIDINLDNNPNGIYLVKLTANGQTVTKRIVLQK